MKKVRRILALVLIVVIALTAVPMTASAGIADTAKSITSGKAVTTTLNDLGDQADYKINVSKSGKLNVSVNAQMQTMRMMVYDSKGNIVEPISYSSTSGKCSYYDNFDCLNITWNRVVEQSDYKVVYPVNKGTYYIRYEWEWNIYADNQGNGKIKFTATYPSTTTTTSAKAKISYLSMTISRGSTIQLGAVVSPSNSKVTWKSSKTSVATVNSKGKVTAKAKGTAIITAKCGTSTQKIKIVVK